MAIAYVQSAAVVNNTTDTVVVHTPAFAIPNNFVTVQIEYGAVSPTGFVVSSVTDDGGNMYHQAVGALAYDSTTCYRSVDIWYANITTPAEYITVVYSGPETFGVVSVVEWTGVDTVSPFDFGAHTIESGTSSPVGPTMTPTVPGELLLAVCNSNDTGESGVNGPWSATPPFGADCIAYYIDAPLSAQQAVFVPPDSQSFVTAAAAFKPAGGSSVTAKQKASTFLVE